MENASVMDMPTGFVKAQQMTPLMSKIARLSNGERSQQRNGTLFTEIRQEILFVKAQHSLHGYFSSATFSAPLSLDGKTNA